MGESSRGDIWIGVGLLAFCGFAALRTIRIPSVATGTSAGPDFVPWLMIASISLLSAALILRALGQRKLRPLAAQNTPEDQDDAIDLTMQRNTALRIAAFVALLISYAALFMPLGYFATTITVFIAGMALLGERRPL
ncbi:tripartite tricarboxylate transporter TctB family protein, partial [Tropicimonas sp.]|uniref:tripartite tricarboxylate transporter TctB family protein n=1 Tax=Tropicimonas sp. TaxID=2067044 RepID=UPI003A89D7FF